MLACLTLLLSLLTGLAVSVPEAQAAGTNYYVSAAGSDSNDGLSESTAFRTIQRAADLTNPGDTVYIMNGTYTETREGEANFIVKRSGSAAGGYITYKAYPGHKPKISVQGVWHHILITASYIRIEGLELEGPRPNITYDQAYARYTYYKQREASGAPIDWAYIGQTQTGGIFARPSHATPDVFLHHIEILNNHVYNMAGGGIGFEKTDYIRVEGNRVHDTSNWTIYANSGISVWHPTNSDSYTGHKIFIERNVSYNNECLIPWIVSGQISDGNGIIIDDTKFTQERGMKAYAGKIRVANNLSYNNGGSGIHAYSSQNVDIVNNTAYGNSKSPALDYGGIFANDSSNVNILNNIVYARTGEKVNDNYRNSNVVYNYNLYYNGPVTVSGPNDITANPAFVNPAAGDFRIAAGSPALDSGTSQLAPATDLDGSVRPQGTGYDRGAYEGASDAGGADAVPPSAPSGLTASARTSTSISLTWQPSTDNVGVTGYEVFKDGVPAASTTGTNAVIQGLAPNTQYRFAVRARDAAGNLSAFSSELLASTTVDTGSGDTTAPTAPTGLTSTGKTSTTVSLVWNASADNVGVASYEVYASGVLAGSSAATSYTVTGLSPGTRYTFTVKAKDAAGNLSASSNSFAINTNR